MSTRSLRSSTEGLAALLLLAGGLCLGPAVTAVTSAGAQDVSQEAVREQVRAVLGQGYQQDLPGASDEAGGDGSGSGSGRPPGLSSPPADGGRSMPSIGMGEALSWLIRATFGMLGIAALVLLVTWVLRDLPSWGWSRRSRKAGADKAAPGAPDGPPDPERGPTLADAERLASQERWTEAVHLLLLVAIRHLTVRFSIPQAASRTSREIARLVPLQRETRDAFAGLVRTVEVSLFGGASLGPDEYRNSLESLRLLLGRVS